MQNKIILTATPAVSIRNSNNVLNLHLDAAAPLTGHTYFYLEEYLDDYVVFVGDAKVGTLREVFNLAREYAVGVTDLGLSKDLTTQVHTHVTSNPSGDGELTNVWINPTKSYGASFMKVGSDERQTIIKMDEDIYPLKETIVGSAFTDHIADSVIDAIVYTVHAISLQLAVDDYSN